MPSKYGGTGYDYPFAIRNFDEPEIYTSMNQDIEQGNVILSGKMRAIKDMEKYMNIVDNSMLYYYTCCISENEADIEARYIKSVYDKLKRDMPNYDFASRVLPIVIDIEEFGDEKSGEYESDEIKQEIKKDRTEAIIHLINKLKEYGVIDERGVIIYGDLNRMKDGSYIEWKNLFNTLNNEGINTVKWGTRAISQTFEGEHYNSDSIIDNLMNDKLNIDYMKSNYGGIEPYLSDVAIQQLHLNQVCYNGSTWYEEYDVSITTKNTIEAIKRGEPLNYQEGFISRIESVYEKGIDKKTDEAKKDFSDDKDDFEI